MWTMGGPAAGIEKAADRLSHGARSVMITGRAPNPQGEYANNGVLPKA
jgi:hypothetical protein